VFQFPGGLADHLPSNWANAPASPTEPFTGRQDFPDKQGSAEWAVAWPLCSDGAQSYYCNTIPTPDGGTHEAGLRAALTKGIRAFGELVGNKRAKEITADDVFNGIELMLSVFIRNPHFQSQTKDRLTSLEAARFVEARFATISTISSPTTWTAAAPCSARSSSAWRSASSAAPSAR
jgi:topoisomerase IV subunit B